MKELEKLGPKQKGVISQAVPDVVKGLCDDGMVSTDKVGSGVYYWCFPSDEVNRRNLKEKALRAEIEELKERRADAENNLLNAREARSSADRQDILARLAAAEQEERELLAQVALMAENDPALYDAMIEDAREALDAANRWTDNIFNLRQYCLSMNSSIAEPEFNKHFNM